MKLLMRTIAQGGMLPAAFRRLCVETLIGDMSGVAVTSRLQAAVC